jgi:hypothetical protein
VQHPLLMEEYPITGHDARGFALNLLGNFPIRMIFEVDRLRVPQPMMPVYIAVICQKIDDSF